MEVHLQGLPEHLPEKDLHKKLLPTMTKLGIPSDAFSCEKPRSRKWANVTFLESGHAHVFLKMHGEKLVYPQSPHSRRRPSAASSGQGSVNGTVNGAFNRPARPQRKARLHLIGNEVFCSISKNPNDPKAAAKQPNPITLRGLKHAAEERANPTYKKRIDGSPEVLRVESLSCGHNVWDGDRLVFVPEVEFQGTGIAKFSKQILLIKLQSKHVIKIPLISIQQLVCSFGHVLTLTLSEEPSFFIDTGDLVDEFQKLSLFLGSTGRSNEPTRSRVCSLDERHGQVVGQCLVYQLQVSGPYLVKQIQALKNHDVLSSSFTRFDLFTQPTPPSELGSSRAAMRRLTQLLAKYTTSGELPFGILVQLQALACNAYMHPGTVYALAEKLCQLYKLDRATGRRPVSVDALKKLFKQTDWPSPNGDPSHFNVDSIIELLRANEDEFSKNIALRQGLHSPSQNLALIHRATVTPSRITLHGPELEAQNRILRKFPDHHEYFIRVQFCDENGLDLFFNPKVNYDVVYDRFRHVLRNGIQIAGRTYSYLGFSHSSLRSHSAWFSAPFVDNDGNLRTYFNIIPELGTFHHIRSPARCAARIGQAFSETPFYIPLDEHNIKIVEIPDVKSPDGQRVFSDGVATMSWDVVYTMWDVLPQKKASPTAAQVRMRGSKGMIAVDPSLTGSVVCIRPSMKKFESNDTANLEICDTASKPIPLVLNRQMVKILEDMGLDHGWFFKMQNIELTRLREVTANAYNVAVFLKQQDVGESIKLHRLFRQAERMGIDYRKDGFLCSVVEAVVLRELRLLKHKARIPIRKGITLFGIMDETGFLEENQVYITYDTMEGRFEQPPGAGPLLVTRSPALHPGDIQLPHHVIPPAGHPLQAQCNVIVFSSKGNRDLPSQLSGGDLDGDIYNIIWDSQAWPHNVFVAADYPRVPPRNLRREVTREDMADFFVDFMRQDNLGVIATRHMILADQMEEGTLHPDCLKLAGLHSTAVDFSKTGIPVDMRDLPRANKFRPDFLGTGPEVRIVDKSTIELDDYIFEPAEDEEEDQYSAPRHQYYKSEKLLGKLYRSINEEKIWYEDVKSKVRPLGASFWDGFIVAVRTRYEAVVSDGNEWISRLETARELRSWYEVAISYAMLQFSEHPVRPISELEVFIGAILNKSGVQTNRQRDNSIKLRDEFSRISSWITSLMRKDRLGVDAPLTGYESRHDSLHICFACVMAGGENTSGLHDVYQDMQSFRVVAACALLGELGLHERVRRGGGYVGVRSGDH